VSVSKRASKVKVNGRELLHLKLCASDRGLSVAFLLAFGLVWFRRRRLKRFLLLDLIMQLIYVENKRSVSNDQQ